MNKKIVVILSLAILAILAVGAVSAAEVTIGGLNFTVPDGYKENVTQEIVNAENQVGRVNYTMNAKVFEKGNSEIAVLVSDYGIFNVTDEIVQLVGGQQKTIKNVSGFYNMEGNFTSFSFAKNGDLVVLSANDEKAIEDFLG